MIIGRRRWAVGDGDTGGLEVCDEFGMSAWGAQEVQFEEVVMEEVPFIPLATGQGENPTERHGVSH